MVHLLECYDGAGRGFPLLQDAALLLESTADFLAQLPSYAAVCGTGNGRAAEGVPRRDAQGPAMTPLTRSAQQYAGGVQG